jgi:hypothetical protein
MREFFDRCDEFTGPEKFREIRFRPGVLGEKRVHFICGNSECDVLKDLQATPKITGEGRVFEWPDPKWPKKLTYKQARLLYRYFKSCYSELTCSKNGVLVRFRHMNWRSLETGIDKKYGDEEITEPVVCGHSREMIRKGNVYQIDSSIEKQQIGIVPVGVVSIDREFGFSVLSLGPLREAEEGAQAAKGGNGGIDAPSGVPKTEIPLLAENEN